MSRRHTAPLDLAKGGVKVNKRNYGVYTLGSILDYQFVQEAPDVFPSIHLFTKMNIADFLLNLACLGKAEREIICMEDVGAFVFLSFPFCLCLNQGKIQSVCFHVLVLMKMVIT